MSNVPTVGIVGGGFVGGAIADCFEHYTDVRVADRDPNRASHELYEVAQQDVIFVCLPTPMNRDGSVNVSVVENVLWELADMVTSRTPVIIKSTVPGKDLERWYLDLGQDLEIIFNPEFLTERTARYDMQQATRHIFGAGGPSINPEVARLFDDRFPMSNQIWTSFKAASLVKYFTNVFFATKVSLMNEFYQICQAHEVDYDHVIGMVMLDHRIGRSHFKVPGHDGHMGFGGHCFPKDLNGYMTIAREAGLTPDMAYAAWLTNLKVRPEKDWEQDIGRAVAFTPEDDGDE